MGEVCTSVLFILNVFGQSQVFQFIAEKHGLKSGVLTIIICGAAKPLRVYSYLDHLSKYGFLWDDHDGYVDRL